MDTVSWEDVFNEKTVFDTPCGKCGRVISDGMLYYFGTETARKLQTTTGIICPSCLYESAREYLGSTTQREVG